MTGVPPDRPVLRPIPSQPIPSQPTPLRPTPTQPVAEDPDARIEQLLQELPKFIVDDSDPSAAQLDLGASIEAVSAVHSGLQRQLSDLSH